MGERPRPWGPESIWEEAFSVGRSGTLPKVRKEAKPASGVCTLNHNTLTSLRIRTLISDGHNQGGTQTLPQGPDVASHNRSRALGPLLGLLLPPSCPPHGRRPNL